VDAIQQILFAIFKEALCEERDAGSDSPEPLLYDGYSCGAPPVAGTLLATAKSAYNSGNEDYLPWTQS
jgi:hypothetical protein